MGEKIVIGPINKGLRNDRTAFVIDNDSFPNLINAYQWRGRVKRKRGTSLLGRLKRYFNSNSTSYSSTATIALSGGAANILTGFSLQTNGNIVPSSVTIVNTTVAQIYTDNGVGGLTGNLGGTGTINYATGAITITGGGTNSIRVIFNYYPDLPVMGLEDFIDSTQSYPQTIAFDITYSYRIVNSSPYSIYDVSFYKNPPSTTYNGQSYTQKTNVTPTTWNGQDYQQFWTVNYQGALWTTNGTSVPFTVTSVGMQYKPIVTVTVVSGGPPASANLEITSHGLVVGDYVFINEVSTTTGINLQTGYVTSVPDANHVVVGLPYATIASSGSGGIAQYLTNRSDTTKDCLRWYDGDPTDGNATTPTLNGRKGWVNFAPPLSQADFPVSENPEDQYYLVGAKMIVPFKDRLVFFGPVIQTSTAGSQLYLQDTMIWSQNGTPYYTCSFTGDPTLPTTDFHPLLVPTNQGASAASYFEDQPGFGGFLQAGVDQPIVTVSSNEDVLVLGFTTIQTRLVYSGNDLLPFNLFQINSELGSSSTFSAVNFDKGVISRGSRGFVITSQTDVNRIDIPIPDQVFEISLTNNGAERVCAQRDFISEWIYFTYPSNTRSWVYPNQTLQYNYRDDSWAIFNECYTSYGLFRKTTGYTWATIGTIFPTWSSWNETWGSGSSTLLNPQVIGGNQQGFVLIRDDGTNEGNSLYIRSISGSTITSPNHSLNQGDFIIISGAIGTISTQLNGNIFQVGITTTNTFVISPTLTGGTYFGGGVVKRIYIPFIQTKQFPVSWDMARKTRLGPQQYLFTTTSKSQITLLIYLSQNGTNPYNDGPIVPSTNVDNSALIYSAILYTCPESTNLGLTPANINLNLITAQQQQQTWHRMNTSLLGDTVQIGFTMSAEQVTSVDDDGVPVNAFSEIEFHSAILDVQPSQMLC